MKKTLINFSISFGFIFILSLIFIALISVLTMNHIIPYTLGEQINYSLSVLLFFFFAFIFAHKQKRHGLIHGLILGTIYFLLTILISNTLHIGTPIILELSKTFALIFGSVLGVNFVKETKN